MHGSRGCIGCSTIPPAYTLVGGESKGQTVKEDKRLEDLSSSSSLEMDQSAAQSQKSIPSIGTPSQPSVPETTADPQSDHPHFVNHGLLLWNQIREQWLQNRRSESRSQELREPTISDDATYESLLGSNEPFPQPITLGEMIDFLVDIWDEEGLYD